MFKFVQDQGGEKLKQNVYKGILVFVIIIILSLDHFFVLGWVSVGKYKIFIIIVNCLFSIFIATFIHELGHQIISIFLGMKSYVFSCYPFILIRKNNKWCINIHFKNNTDILGFIIPNIPVIRDLHDYNLNLRKIVLATLAGPIASILLGIVCLLFPTNIVEIILLKKILGITSLFLSMVSLIYGDGPMFLLLLTNKNYALKSLMSFNNNSSNYFSNNYLYKVAEVNCGKINFKNIDEITLVQFEIQSYLIYNSVLNNNYNYPEILKKNIENFIKVEIELENLKPEIVLYIHTVIIYLTLVENNFDLANKLYNVYLFKHEKILNDNYFMQRSRYFLGYLISLEQIMDLLDNCFEYAISENYNLIEKKLITLRSQT